MKLIFRKLHVAVSKKILSLLNNDQNDEVSGTTGDGRVFVAGK